MKKTRTSPREAFAATTSEAVLAASVAASERASKERRATRKPPGGTDDESDDSEPRRLHLDKRAEMLIACAPEGSDDELLTTKQVASWFGTSPQWLELGRIKGYGPPYLKIAPGMIRYKRGTTKEWLREREHKSTAEYT